MTIDEFIRTLIGYEAMEVTDFDEEENEKGESIFVAKVELNESERYKCPVCGSKCGKYGYGVERTKRWRSLDLGKNRFYVECENPRCICPAHGVRKQACPWAFPDSDYTKAFEMQVAHMAANAPTNLVSKKYRIKWGTVGSCVSRVQKHIWPAENRKRRLKRLAIDETSYKKGYKYITIVLDLDTDEVIWAFDGYGDGVLEQFFKTLTPEQLDAIEFVVADGAKYITRQVEKYCKNATRCIDPFHVVQWTTETLDTVRKRLSNDAKKNGLRC
jgi:transposase